MDLFCWYGQPNPPPPTQKKKTKKKNNQKTNIETQKKQKKKKRRKKKRKKKNKKRTKKEQKKNKKRTKKRTKKEQKKNKKRTKHTNQHTHEGNPLVLWMCKNSNLILSCHNHKMWFLFVSFLLPHWFCFVIFFNLFAIIYFIHNRVVIDHFMRLVVVYWSGMIY